LHLASYRWRIKPVTEISCFRESPTLPYPYEASYHLELFIDKRLSGVGKMDRDILKKRLQAFSQVFLARCLLERFWW
jgi:hypothetical protein